jgi:DNA-binding NarL/FixJ family response regulator
MPALRTLIVEDYEPFRQRLREALQDETDCVVVGEASDGVQAVELAQELQPDLILLDLALPKQNGMESARRIRQLCPNSKMIFLSQDSSPEIVQGALSVGAAGYLLKSDAMELPLAIDAVLQGTVFISSHVKRPRPRFTTESSSES